MPAPIYCDRPRRYSKRGKRWSHIFALDENALMSFAKTNNLKRRDISPFLHYDVTEEELAKLQGVTLVTRKEFKVLKKELKRSESNNCVGMPAIRRRSKPSS